MPETMPSVGQAGFFDEEPGQKSSMRLMNVLIIGTILLVFIIQNAFAIYQAFAKDLNSINPVAFSEGSVWILAIAVMGKVGQKGIENIEKISEAMGKFAEAMAKLKGTIIKS